MDSKRPYRTESLLEGALHALRARSFLLAGICVFSMGATLAHHFFLQKYRADVTLIVSNSDNSPLQANFSRAMPSSAAGIPSLGKSTDEADRYAFFLKSDNFMSEVAAKLTADTKYTSLIESIPRPGVFGRILHRIFFERPVKGARTEDSGKSIARSLDDMTVIRKTNSDYITLTVSAKDPEAAVALANTLGELASQYANDKDLVELRAAIRYTENQISSIAENIDQVGQEIVEYKRKLDIISPETERSEALAVVQQHQRDLNENRIKYQQNSNLIKQFEESLAQEEKTLMEEGSQGVEDKKIVTRLRQRIERLKYKLGLMNAQGFDSSTWQVKELQADLDSTIERLRQAVHEKGPSQGQDGVLVDDKEGKVKKLDSLRQENQTIEARIEGIKSSLSRFKREFTQLPKGEQVLTDFQRKLVSDTEIQQGLKRQLIQLKMQEAAFKEKVHVVERASVASIPERLRAFPKVLIALLISLILGSVVIYSLEEVDPRVRSRKDLEYYKISTIAGIPKADRSWFQGFRRRYRGDHEWFYNYNFEENPDSAMTLGFQYLSEKLIELSAGSHRAISILSPGPGDGKSYLAWNLAVWLGKHGKKVLLIDCHFRNPTLSGLIEGVDHPGLMTAMAAEGKSKSSYVRDVLPGVDFIPAGKFGKNPTELIGQEKFAQLVQSSKQLYDIVLIDTPPITQAPDAIVIAALTDFALVILGQRITRLESLEVALRRLREIPAGKVKFLFNRVATTGDHLEIFLRSRRASSTKPEPERKAS